MEIKPVFLHPVLTKPARSPSTSSQLTRENTVHDGTNGTTITDVDFITKKHQKGKYAQIEPEIENRP